MPFPSTPCDEEGLRMIDGRNWPASPCSFLFLPVLRVLRASVVSFPHGVNDHARLARLQASD